MGFNKRSLLFLINGYQINDSPRLKALKAIVFTTLVIVTISFLVRMMLNDFNIYFTISNAVFIFLLFVLFVSSRQSKNLDLILSLFVALLSLAVDFSMFLENFPDFGQISIYMIISTSAILLASRRILNYLVWILSINMLFVISASVINYNGGVFNADSIRMMYFILVFIVASVMMNLLIRYLFGYSIEKYRSLRELNISLHIEKKEAIDKYNLLSEINNNFIEQHQRFIAEEEMRKKSLIELAHEINIPISVLLGASKLINQGDVSQDKNNRYLNSINFSSNHLFYLSRQMKDVVNLTYDKIKIVNKAGKLYEDINNFKFIFYSILEETDIDFVCDFDEQLTGNLYSYDSTRVNQVLFNLLTNALMYTKEGRIIFSVKKVGSHENKDIVSFSVKDSGKGIRPENQKAILNKWKNVAPDYDDEINVDGIGLSVCVKIVEALGSNIQIQSKIGEGTEFSFELALPFFKMQEKRIANTINFNNQKRVIVFDPNQMNRILLTKLLINLGINVVSFRTEAQFIDFISTKSDNYDLVFFDIDSKSSLLKKQEKDGDSLLDLVKKQIPIIAMSSGDMFLTRQKAASFGFTSQLQKPIESVDLIDLLLLHL